MRLALKISFAVLLGVALLISLNSYLNVVRERDRLKTELSREARQIGGTFRIMVKEIWSSQGELAARAFLKRAGQWATDHHVRWVWLEGDDTAELPPVEIRPRLEATKQEETVTIMVENEAGADFLVTYLPLRVPNGRLGAIEIGESLDGLHGYVRESLQRSGLLLAAVVVASLMLIGVLGSLWISRPVKRLTAQAERIAAGDFSGDLGNYGKDEIGTLALALERMRGQLASAREADQERLAALEKLRHTERLATIGRLSAGMAHELGTPLNVVAGRAKLIASGELEADEVVRSARIIGEQSERMTTIMRQLLDFARHGASRKQPLDLGQLMAGVAEMMQPTAKKQAVNLICLPTREPVRAMADAGQLQQVLANLVMNAIQAQPEGGDVMLSLACPESEVRLEDRVEQRLMAELLVEDAGPGINPEDLTKIFDPFFTTKEIGQGTGLGLAIAWGIVSEHGGRIEADNRTEGGAVFRVLLPLELEKTV
ncbi:MAG: histidine kinase [Desulfuromonas sp.]|nr:MAG: histidine kinase [Desulfuromonas sp.]